MCGKSLDARCGCCYYGLYTIVPLFFLTIATALSWLVTWDCRFFRVTYDSILVNDTSLISTQPYSYAVGPWMYEDFYLNPDETNGDLPSVSTGDCTFWNRNSHMAKLNIDGSMYFGRSITFIVMYSSIILGLLACIMLCAAYPSCATHSMRLCFVVLGFCMPMTFIMLTSNVCREAIKCELTRDAYASIAASILWWITGLTMLCMPKQLKKPLNLSGMCRCCLWPCLGVMSLCCCLKNNATVKGIQKENQRPGSTVTSVDELINEEDGSDIIITKTRSVSDDGKTVVEKEIHVVQLIPKKFGRKSSTTGPRLMDTRADIELDE